MTDDTTDRPPTGFPEPPGKDPGDKSRDPTPHTSLNTPVGEPDPNEDLDLDRPTPPEGDRLDD